ncbi:MAG: integrase core domain-containing protein [Methylocella sp.]
MPDPVKAKKIDGGPEFMDGFEQACADRNLPLYVLPPHSPKLNASVERWIGARRYEFYACVEIPGEIKKIADLVNGFQHLYNYHRPHGALAGATPAQYLKIRETNKACVPHVS